MILVTIALIIAAHFSRQRGDNLLAFGFFAVAMLLVVPTWPSALWNLLQGLPAALPSSLIGSVVMLVVAIIGVRYVFSLNR